MAPPLKPRKRRLSANEKSVKKQSRRVARSLRRGNDPLAGFRFKPNRTTYPAKEGYPTGYDYSQEGAGANDAQFIESLKKFKRNNKQNAVRLPSRAKQ